MWILDFGSNLIIYPAGIIKPTVGGEIQRFTVLTFHVSSSFALSIFHCMCLWTVYGHTEQLKGKKKRRQKERGGISTFMWINLLTVVKMSSSHPHLFFLTAAKN